MNESYYTNQNITNNIDTQNYFISQKKNSFKPVNKVTNRPLQVGFKSIKINKGSYGIEEVPQKEEDIDHLQKFHLEKGVNQFQFNKNRTNSLNTNKIPHFPFTKSIQNENNLNKGVSGKIPHPRKTHGFIPVDRNKIGVGLISHKRNASGERPPAVKQVQSKYSSASENRYHFLHRIAGSQKFGMDSFSSNNIPRINYGPIDSVKGLKNQSNRKPINNMNNIKNVNVNTVNDIYSNSNRSKIEQQNYIQTTDNSQNKTFDERDNRFLNNKTTSNYDYNTVNGTKLQNNIQLVKINQNNNNNNNNNNASNYYNLKNSPSLNNINGNSQNYIINNDVNLGNPRLTTVGIRYINNTDKNINPFLRPITPQQIQTQTQNLQLNFNQPKNNNKDPEIAIVTKISSSKNNNNFGVNQNIEQIINQVNRPAYNTIQNNFGGQIITNNPQIIVNQGNTNQINQIVNQTSNNYLTQQQLNQLLNENLNTFINPQGNTYMPQNIIPPKINIKLANYKNNYNTFNQPESERLTIVNDKINNNALNTNQQLLNNNNNIDLTYKDFDGSGLVKNFNGVSRPGKDASGKTKTNQDSFVIKTNINNIKDFNMFGVLDGHGQDGHFVSEFVSELIPSQIINHPEIKILKNTEAIYQKLKENNCKIITQAFITADKQLGNMEFDVSESGCTCCLVIHLGKHILCANTGDSRAILVFDQANSINKKDLNYLNVVPLSIDFKPELPEETNRIVMAGGEVEQMKDEYGEGLGPYRVWAKGKDYPGLAMSRSIGDLKGKSIGVIPDPGILEYNLNNSTKYIVVCSDGVWEFLENQTVMNIGKKFYLENNASAFCHELVSKAFDEWQENDSIVDDITAVIAFF